MTIKTYKQIRAAVAFFVAATVSVSVTTDNFLLAAAAVVTGMLFMTAARLKAKITVDERAQSIGEKAARLTYSIFTPTIAFGSLFLYFTGQKYPYLLALGQVFAYLTLFLIFIYSLSYHYLNIKYGGNSDEE